MGITLILLTLLTYFIPTFRKALDFSSHWYHLTEMILRELRAIDHIGIIRIGTRMLVFILQCITDELCDMLKQFPPP